MLDRLALRGEALKLPVADRLELAQELIRSVDEGQEENAEEAWAEEIERRAREVADGSVETIDADEVHRRVRARLQEVRARRGTE